VFCSCESKIWSYSGYWGKWLIYKINKCTCNDVVHDENPVGNDFLQF